MSALIAGSTYAITIEAVETNTFPLGSVYYGEVRYTVKDEAALLILSSANGRVERINDKQIVVTFPGAETAQWRNPEVIFDLWRVDQPDPLKWTATISIPVELSPTRRPA